MVVFSDMMSTLLRICHSYLHKCPLLRRNAPDQHKNSNKQQECLQLQDIGVNTDTDEVVSVVAQLEREVSILCKESDLSVNKFRLQTIAGAE